MLLHTPEGHIGWQAEGFELPDVEGRLHRLSDYLGGSALLVAFICNHCPYVQTIADRLAQDTDELMAEGINVLAIMSNDFQAVSADSPANMKRFAAQHRFEFPYLVDKDQSVAKTYGAVCTPDFFGFTSQGRLQYRGRLDDAGRGASDHRCRELVEAMRQIAKTQKGPEVQHPSIGCSIKWR
ncbi:thioredoxin family protein [Pseudophaeobacter sp.]|uniref:thioredoxin family protein n=1 Tax=Pseudophaeobacter sp. TaxID=1971739 RepID=UPI00329967C6